MYATPEEEDLANEMLEADITMETVVYITLLSESASTNRIPKADFGVGSNRYPTRREEQKNLLQYKEDIHNYADKPPSYPSSREA